MNKQAKVSNSYVGSIGLYKCIVNTDTQSIRIANADGQVNFYSADVSELLRLQKQGEQLSLLDKREYPQGEGV